MIQTSETKQIADLITQTSFDGLPEDVIRKAKFLVLDSIGCGFGGSVTTLGETVQHALAKDSIGNAPIIGSEKTTSVPTAAYINATLINALDYDDSSPGGHLSSTIVGTLVAYLNDTKASCRDWLLSYIVGFEVCSRVAIAAKPTAERFAEVWGLGTTQTFGAVAAAAKLQNTNSIQTLDALGIAGASAPVPSAQKWGWDIKPLTWMKDAVALPSQIGVNATKLAIAGVVGCRDILDGPKGFWRMAGSDQCDFELMTAGIGKKYWLIDASYKTYSCCWFIHPALDAIGSIVQAQNLSWNDVQRIDVWSLTDLAEMFTDKGPTAMVDAQFSLPYCVAMKLLGIQSGPAWFEESRFSDCDVASITSRVHIYADKNADIIFQNEDRRITARVMITTSKGEEFETVALAPRGSPSIPISEDEVIQKFLSLAEPILGNKKSKMLKDFILQLDSVNSVSPMSNLLAK